MLFFAEKGKVRMRDFHTLNLTKKKEKKRHK